MKFPLKCRRIEIRGSFMAKDLVMSGEWQALRVWELWDHFQCTSNILCFLPSVEHSSKLINQSRGCGNPVHIQPSRKTNEIIVWPVLGTKSTAWYHLQVDSIKTELNEKAHCWGAWVKPHIPALTEVFYVLRASSKLFGMLYSDRQINVYQISYPDTSKVTQWLYVSLWPRDGLMELPCFLIWI